ncbi:hypothetical protein DB2_56 [Octadecabacter Antarctic DB virus 2]|nr:hypothetical protein DB2_56 [Octadecabacter Antarctic DB virus 2]
MKYGWEKNVEEKMAEFQDILDDKYQIVGVAIENIETGEGALIEADIASEQLHDVTEADVRQDILGDATQQYQRAYKKVFGKFQIKGKGH